MGHKNLEGDLHIAQWQNLYGGTRQLATSLLSGVPFVHTLALGQAYKYIYALAFQGILFEGGGAPMAPHIAERIGRKHAPGAIVALFFHIARAEGKGA